MTAWHRMMRWPLTAYGQLCQWVHSPFTRSLYTLDITNLRPTLALS